MDKLKGMCDEHGEVNAVCPECHSDTYGKVIKAGFDETRMLRAEIERWQEASMLNVSCGDPSYVTPEHLEKVRQADEQLRGQLAKKTDALQAEIERWQEASKSLASAHLRAAAPQLLTALKSLKVCSEDAISSDPDMATHEETMTQFDIAIANAQAAIMNAGG